jgi:hypothetical protein
VPKWHPIRGLVYEIPGPYVSPWQDYGEIVLKELPADIPSDEAPVARLPGGRVALQRRGELDLLRDPTKPDRDLGQL